MKDDSFSKYNRNETIRSIYFYSDCDVLKNTLGIKDEELLKALEQDLTSHRLAELSEEPLRGIFGITHLKNIHKYIFQDIYPFAGKFREEDIWKGDTFFCKSQFVYQVLTELLEKLKSENCLVGLGMKKFSQRAAFYMAELNMIHPFREGNGRTIREFIRCLALKCGYAIDWSIVDSQKILNASILSADKILDPLADYLYESIEK
ncbi:MAG: Fic family protein [Bacillota bacterium]|nr:Fic family protein [Bacillota bacterium]